ncbi:hypothetical protein BKA62DRAFT_820698, partial [Auriculariales sp. MPI-PUGE-AT-0066]
TNDILGQAYQTESESENGSDNELDRPRVDDEEQSSDNESDTSLSPPTSAQQCSILEHNHPKGPVPESTTNNQVVSSPLADSLGISVNRFHRFLICLSPQCQRVIPPGRLAAHLKRRHKLAVSLADCTRLAELAGARDGPVLPAPLSPAIDGIPVYAGWRCTGCSFACQSDVSRTRHKCKG